MSPFSRRSAPSREAHDSAAQVATEQALSRTRRSWFGRLASALGGSDLSDELWESLEEMLIGADAGVGATAAVLDRVRAAAPRDAGAVRALLREQLIAVLRAAEGPRGRLWDGAGNPTRSRRRRRWCWSWV